MSEEAVKSAYRLPIQSYGHLRGNCAEMGTGGALTVHAVALCVALMATTACTPVLRRIAVRLDWLDWPAGHKTHERPVPLLGGVAIFAGLGIAMGAVMLTWPVWAAGHVAELAAVAVGATLIVGLGVVDDLRDLGPGPKLAVQTIAALPLAFAFGGLPVISNPLGGEPISLGPLAVPIATVWIVGVTNAFNLIDGLDGLAGGVAGICALTLLANLWGDAGPYPLLAAATLGASLGFLPHNFPPARIFLGDAGALLLGFMLGAASLGGFQKGTTLVTLIVPLMALGLPILNTVLALARGIRLRESPLRPHRDHLHDRLVRIGLTPRAAVLLLYVVTAYLGGVALALRDVPPNMVLRFAFVMAGAGIFGLRALVFVERRLSAQRDEAARRATGSGSVPPQSDLLILCEAGELSESEALAIPALGARDQLGSMLAIDDRRWALLPAPRVECAAEPEAEVRDWFARTRLGSRWKVRALRPHPALEPGSAMDPGSALPSGSAPRPTPGTAHDRHPGESTGWRPIATARTTRPTLETPWSRPSGGPLR